MNKRTGRVHDRHARVHFRRGDIAPLHSFPSADGQKRALRGRLPHFAGARYLAAGASLALSLAVAGIFGLWIAVNAGFGHDTIVQNAEAALNDIIPGGVGVTIGDTGLSFDASSLLALEARDIRVRQQQAGAEKTIEIGKVRLGLNLFALITGELKIGRLQIADASVDASQAGFAGDGGVSVFLNSDGLYDPDKITGAVFEAAQRISDQLKSAGTRSITVRDVGINFDTRPLQIEELKLSHTGTRDTRVSARMDLSGHPVTLSGEIVGNEDGGIARLTAEIALTDFSTSQNLLPRAHVRSLALILTGGKPFENAAGKLHAHIEAEGLRLLLRADEELPGRLVADTQLGEQSGKLEIAAGTLELGHSVFPFSGAVAPQKANAANANPTYKWEVVSNDAVLVPADTEEARLPLNGRLAGTFDPATYSLAATDLGVRTNGGEVIGSANIVFAEPSPAAFLALRVPRIPVSHAKQLWPWLAAPGAREWVVANLFDGMVTDSTLELSVGPGRLTDDIPLTPEEIWGHFSVSGTRFDIVGEIPPVRDADGTIDFAGSRVEIGLARGTAYMRGDKTVAASNGTMVIEDADSPVAFGKMKIDVAGDAASIVELASRDPIRATEKLGMEPDEFTGQVDGTVRADIPLKAKAPGDVDNWDVMLGFTGLAVSKEFDGQKLSDATGTVAIDPLGARFEADGKLNDLPAKLVLVEPLAAKGPDTVRDITIEFDDKARNELAPGLSNILSGPVAVRFFSLADQNGYRVEANLGKAEFKLPWIGWRKGKGVPATAHFDMTEAGNETLIDKFEISSKTFSMAGSLKLSGDELVEANFPTMKLNRNDDIAVRITRKNKRYSVKITGTSFDARSLVRQVRADSDEVVDAGDGTPLTLDARVDTISGFGGEVLRGVKIDYSSDGKLPAKADASAIAASGGAISISDAGGEDRKISIQAADAGALLRFLDYYENMSGGEFDLAMNGTGPGTLAGHIDIRNFVLVDEPRLRSIVENPAPSSDGRSLNDAVKGKLDTSRVSFDRGYVQLVKSDDSLRLTKGVLRGPMIGTTFQGAVYDRDGNMSITGTFMPAYGLNRIFGEIPVLGLVLGNGRDGGLIGITYKLTGDAKEPRVQVNPISVIAPGIFRSIFEFR